MKRVLLFGVTGSIGLQALDLISQHPDQFSLFGISARSQLEKLLEIAERFRPPYLAIPDEETGSFLRSRLSYRAELFLGDKGLAELASLPGADIVIVAISGIKGLIPAYEALKKGKRVALANKEGLIGGGFLLFPLIKEEGGEIIPIDSEHCALFQLLTKEKPEFLRRVYLTASGGPFLNWDLKDFADITPELALKHPTWRMGPKITVDSATLMNKGFEVIEASVLFNLEVDKIEVLIHPQSIVHALVEFVDGTFFAHLSKPDMRLPIAYSLFYPERPPLEDIRLRPANLNQLNFYPPDLQKFPCLTLAYEACRRGHPYPLLLVASDEVAVSAFLQGRIKFFQIPLILEKTLNEFNINQKPSSLEEIFFFHEEVAQYTEELIRRL